MSKAAAAAAQQKKQKKNKTRARGPEPSAHKKPTVSDRAKRSTEPKCSSTTSILGECASLCGHADSHAGIIAAPPHPHLVAARLSCCEQLRRQMRSPAYHISSFCNCLRWAALVFPSSCCTRQKGTSSLVSACAALACSARPLHKHLLRVLCLPFISPFILQLSFAMARCIAGVWLRLRTT